MVPASRRTVALSGASPPFVTSTTQPSMTWIRAAPSSIPCGGEIARDGMQPFSRYWRVMVLAMSPTSSPEPFG
jgi:hypothetical protein